MAGRVGLARTGGPPAPAASGRSSCLASRAYARMSRKSLAPSPLRRCVQIAELQEGRVLPREREAEDARARVDEPHGDAGVAQRRRDVARRDLLAAHAVAAREDARDRVGVAREGQVLGPLDGRREDVVGLEGRAARRRRRRPRHDGLVEPREVGGGGERPGDRRRPARARHTDDSFFSGRHGAEQRDPSTTGVRSRRTEKRCSTMPRATSACRATCSVPAHEAAPVAHAQRLDHVDVAAAPHVHAMGPPCGRGVGHQPGAQQLLHGGREGACVHDGRAASRRGPRRRRARAGRSRGRRCRAGRAPRQRRTSARAAMPRSASKARSATRRSTGGGRPRGRRRPRRGVANARGRSRLVYTVASRGASPRACGGGRGDWCGVGRGF